jgi:hypothetical protein
MSPLAKLNHQGVGDPEIAPRRALAGSIGRRSYHSPRYGRTYCSAMSQGKKIQVSWLTSVM